MNIPPVPHAWSVTPREAIALQKKLRGQVRLTRLKKKPNLVAGVDLAFSKQHERCIAAAVVWDIAGGTVVEEVVAVRKLAFPYVPGLLSFRETPCVLDALAKLKITPDVILCDGHGLAHPRRFGIACHIGVLTRRPTVGCGKSRLIGEHREPGTCKGAKTILKAKGENIGSVVRTRKDVKPVYVSVGHLIQQAQAIRLVLQCCTRYRLPEPIRLADQLVARAKKDMGY